MPLMTDRHETSLILNGKADAVTRVFPGGCPYQIGQMLPLAIDQGERERKGFSDIYATVLVKSLRPMSVDSRYNDDVSAKGEGYTNATAWLHKFQKKYPGYNGQVWRIQFDVKEIHSPKGSVAV